jgi:hypothetical protein
MPSRICETSARITLGFGIENLQSSRSLQRGMKNICKITVDLRAGICAELPAEQSLSEFNLVGAIQFAFK